MASVQVNCIRPLSGAMEKSHWAGKKVGLFKFRGCRFTRHGVLSVEFAPRRGEIFQPRVASAFWESTKKGRHDLKGVGPGESLIGWNAYGVNDSRRPSPQGMP